MQPPPSSLAPVPTSHESKWPPTSDDLLRPLASAKLADDVVGLAVGLEVRLHRQLHADRHAAVLQPLEAVGVLGGNRRRGNLRPLSARSAVAPVCGVRSPVGPTERTSTATAPSAAAREGPLGSIRHRRAVVGERDVEEHDLALRRRRRVSRDRRSRARRGRRLRCRPAGCPPSCRGRASAATAGSARRARGFRGPRTHFGTITGSLRTFSSPSAFIFATAQSIARSSDSDPTADGRTCR